MDTDRFREAYERLRSLDERATHRIRPRHRSASRLSPEQMEERLSQLSSYTVELREIVEELFLSIAGKGKPKKG